MTSLNYNYLSEERRQLFLEKIKQLRPIDDDFMRELFRDNIPLAQMVLRIITGKDDLVITSQETQYDMKLLGSRSICLDVLATDSEGRKYNLEIQRSDSGAAPKRARYHSSAMDVDFMSPAHNFNELPVKYVIFITENDIRKGNRPIYSFERRDSLTGEPLGDDEYIIFVNCAYNNSDDKSLLAELIHDFGCRKAEDMHLELLSKTTEFYKNSQKGVRCMCKLLEDFFNELLAEDAELLKKDVTEQVKKELEEQVKKEVTERVTKELTESVERETAERVERETTERVERETTERVERETANKITEQNALNLLKLGTVSFDDICKVTGVTAEKLRELEMSV